MSLTSANIVRVITELLEIENVQIIIREEETKLITGACQVLGALLGGRNGFLLGSAIGMSAASYLSEVKHISVARLMADYLTPVQISAMIENIIQLIPLACTIVTALQNSDFRQRVVSFIRGFIQDLGLTLA